MVNHMLGLGNKVEDDELNIKILNYFTRTQEPKITTIKESKNLESMSMEALFGKLLAYKNELIQQSHAEDIEKKGKGLHSRLVPQRKTTKKALLMMKMQRI